MSNIIEELFYGNLEPQELTTELTPRLKKKLKELTLLIIIDNFFAYIFIEQFFIRN